MAWVGCIAAAAAKTASQVDKAPQELKETTSKLAQAFDAIHEFAHQGYTRVQLQPLIDNAERLQDLYEESCQARKDHEQNDDDLRNFRLPSRLGPAAAKWAMGSYTIQLDEIQSAVNAEMRVLQRMVPHGQTTGTSPPATQQQDKHDMGKSLLHAAMGSAEQHASYKVGDPIEIWSDSLRAWCSGKVKDIHGNLLGIEYMTADAEIRDKQVSNAADHVRHFQPRKEHVRGDTHKANDPVQIFCDSSNAWCCGYVKHVGGNLVNIEYVSSCGRTLTKQLPNGHEHLRCLHSEAGAVYVVGDCVEYFSTTKNKRFVTEVTAVHYDSAGLVSHVDLKECKQFADIRTVRKITDPCKTKGLKLEK